MVRNNICCSCIQLVCLLFLSSTLLAQIQVSEEPMHKIAVQNKYIRLLDVVINPGDTTLFHVHSTPSLFIYYTNSSIATQVKGAKWAKEQTVEGKVLFRFFSPDSLVHRVANPDTLPMHVNDIEILSSFKKENETPLKPLPFPLLFENKRAAIYRLNRASFIEEKIGGRGPIIIGLISGEGVKCYTSKLKKSAELKPGEYLYIDPNTSFSFSAPSGNKVNLVLLELK